MLSSACSRAFCDWLQSIDAIPGVHPAVLRRAFAAGWKARKAAQYAAMLDDAVRA